MKNRINKWLFLWLSFFLSTSIFSQKAVDKDCISIVEGVLKTASSSSSIFLYEIALGVATKIDSSKIDAQGQFRFSFAPPKEAFYMLGLDGMGLRGRYMFYFKPGDGLNVEMDASSFVLIGKNTAENKALEQWHELILPLQLMSIYQSSATHADYFPVLESTLPKIEAFESTTSNEAFNKAFDLKRKADLTYFSVNLIMSPRRSYPQKEDFPDFYRKIDIQEMGKTSIFMDYPQGMGMLNMCEYVAMLLETENLTAEEKKMMGDPIASLDIKLNKIADPLTQGELVVRASQYLKSKDGFEDFLSKYERFLIHPRQKLRANKSLQALTSEVVEKAADFDFVDIDGKNISLASLRGKLVYIDIWATWCAPCIQQIPYMRDLEKKYHGKDIQFVSVSVDAVRDNQKWRNFIAKESLKGIQLFAGEKSDKFKSDYKVAGIPHFVLIGKDGQLIMNNAPRPSSPEILLMIEKAL